MLPINKLLNLMKSQASGLLNTFSQTRIAIVSTYDPNTYTAQVIIQPEGIQTGFIPILTEWIGNNWGFFAPPSSGDMVIVHFQEGDFSTAFVGQRIFNINQQPLQTPQTVPSGECWFVHKTGTYLRFKNDGTLEIKTYDSNQNPTNINITSNVVITGNLTMEGTGNITATGDILDKSATNTDNMRGMRNVFNAHVHSGIFPGASDTEVSTTNM